MADRFRIIRTKEQKEVEKFASWFHQDYCIMFDDFEVGFQMYIGMLNRERKRILKEELAKFVDDNEGRSESVVLANWLRLGAGAWDANKAICQTLKRWTKEI